MFRSCSNAGMVEADSTQPKHSTAGTTDSGTFSDIDAHGGEVVDPVSIAQHIVRVALFLQTHYCDNIVLDHAIRAVMKDTAKRLLEYPWVLVDHQTLGMPFHEWEDRTLEPAQAIVAMEQLACFFESRDESVRAQYGPDDMETGLAKYLLFAAKYTKQLLEDGLALSMDTTTRDATNSFELMQSLRGRRLQSRAGFQEEPTEDENSKRDIDFNEVIGLPCQAQEAIYLAAMESWTSLPNELPSPIEQDRQGSLTSSNSALAASHHYFSPSDLELQNLDNSILPGFEQPVLELESHSCQTSPALCHTKDDQDTASNSSTYATTGSDTAKRTIEARNDVDGLARYVQNPLLSFERSSPEFDIYGNRVGRGRLERERGVYTNGEM